MTNDTIQSTLGDIVTALDDADMISHAATKKAQAASKQRKPPETLDDARIRILGTKLTAAERDIVESMFTLLAAGDITRAPDAKRNISKKEIFELYAQHRESQRERKRRLVIETRPSNYWIVTDNDTLRQVDKMLWDETEVAADTETTGLDIYNDRIVGYSLYLPTHDVAVYVPFGHTTGQTQVSEEAARMVVEKHFARSNLRTIFHNAKYDLHLLITTWGIHVANVWWDTQVASKLMNEHEPSHRLKDLHARYVLGDGDAAIMFEDLFDDHVIYDKDIVLSGIYAAGDAEKTYKLYKFQKPHIDTRDRLRVVWYEIEQPLLQVDLDMERTGFRIDVAAMERMESQYAPVLQSSEREVLDAFNIDDAFAETMAQHFGKPVEPFNINSNAHLGYLLYDVLGCDPDIGKRFKKASRSTAADVLDALMDEYEALAPLKKYRQLHKIVSTYLHKIPAAMEPATGRLHCRFNNLGGDDDGEGGTATGRYSSSAYVKAKNSRTGSVDKGTNFQNIPSRSREGVLVRMCFVPDEGWLFVSSDLSQIEPRIIAHILYEQFGDDGMRQLYIQGRDLYTEMAMFVFGFDRDFCVDGAYDPTGTFKPRKLMKEGVLAYLYGQSPGSFARRMKVSEEVADAFFTAMISAYPGVAKFRDWVLSMLDKRGPTPYAETLFGRKRRFPDYRRHKAELATLDRVRWNKRTDAQKERRRWLWGQVASAERQAVNAIIQGSAADVLKRAIIRLAALCKEHGWQFNASIHDEVLLSIPKSDVTPDNIRLIDEIMTQTTTFTVPLKCDTVIQPKWMCEYKAWSEWDFDRCRPTDDALQNRIEHDEPTGYEQGA